MKRERERERQAYLPIRRGAREVAGGGGGGWMERTETKLWLLPRDSTKTQSGKCHGLVLTLMCECHLVVCLELHPGLATPGNFILWSVAPYPVSPLHFGSF